jgi:hypothetical protein
MPSIIPAYNSCSISDIIRSSVMYNCVANVRSEMYSSMRDGDDVDGTLLFDKLMIKLLGLAVCQAHVKIHIY